MARKIIPSIYGEKIDELNISDMIGNVLEDFSDPDWYFELHSDWQEIVAKTLEKLDFWSYDYISNFGFYWCGVLTSEPFHLLHMEEEEILNLIKDEHLKLVQTENGLVLRFHNPVKSPLYRFFNKFKEDGFGGNIPYSINVLIKKIKLYLEKEFERNLSAYGEWLKYEEDEEIA